MGRLQVDIRDEYYEWLKEHYPRRMKEGIEEGIRLLLEREEEGRRYNNNKSK